MNRLSPRMLALGTARSEIRDAFAYAQARAAQVGADKVDDFSIGNPSVPAPEAVGRAVRSLTLETDPVLLHGYTPGQGDAGVRQALADDLNRRFGADYDRDCLYLTAGAAGALSCALSAMGCPGDEFLTVSPFFPEYRVFAETAGGTLVPVPACPDTFQPDVAAIAAALTPKTKAVILNTPNNPTGVVYTEAVLRELADLLRAKSAEYGHPVYLISDEPYRELVYGDVTPPWLPALYPDTLVCYSYSKSLSLPGQRIGYVLVPRTVTDFELVYAAVAGAGRALGYVCAPSLFQFVAARCAGLTADLSVYRTNRDLLLSALREMGYRCPQADGAFYLFPQSPEPDAAAFCQKARELDLILVPGGSFGSPDHVRVSYCVPTEQIRRALPKFRALAEAYGLTPGT